MKHVYGYDNKGKEIVFDRKETDIPHMILTHTAGTGKTYNIKQEIISNLLYGDKKDKIIVVDVNGDYKKLSKEYGGEVVNFINTFINPLDNCIDSISEMSDYLISFVELVIEKECTSYQKAVIDKVCVSMYGIYETTLDSDCDTAIRRNECHILSDFYDKLTSFGKETAELSAAIKPYCKGLFNIFAHKTNVNSNSRLIVIDISSIGERRISIALWASLIYIWYVMVEHSYKCVHTWVYLEELNRYFVNTVLSNTLLEIFKRSRIRGGIITGIMQNVRDISHIEQAQQLLDNFG